MITVETKPVRLSAVQWNKEGDAGPELGVHAYRIGTELRHGLHSPAGLQRLMPGDWIVWGGGINAIVYSPAEFHHKFNVIEEGQERG